MAGEEKSKNVVSGSCKYCKNNVANSIAKCIICEAIYHTSCALTVAGLIAVGKNNFVKCCETKNEVSSENAGQAENDTVNSVVKEIVKANYAVLQSKEEIILELRAKETLLYQNIKLLEEKIEKTKVSVEILGNHVNPRPPTWAQQVGQSANTMANKSRSITDISEASHSRKQNNITSSSQIHNLNQNNNNSNYMKGLQVNAGVMEAQTLNKMNEIIQLGQVDQVDNFVRPSENQWQQAKRRRRFVVGKKELR